MRRAAGETLASIAKSYAVDISMIFAVVTNSTQAAARAPHVAREPSRDGPAGNARQAIPPSHRMNVIRCEWARLGLEPTKTGNSVNVRPYLFSISRSPLPRFGS